MTEVARERFAELGIGLPSDGGQKQNARPRRGGPDTVAPFLVWLGSEGSRDVTGRVFSANGSRITLLDGWHNTASFDMSEPFDASQTSAEVARLLAD